MPRREFGKRLMKGPQNGSPTRSGDNVSDHPATTTELWFSEAIGFVAGEHLLTCVNADGAVEIVNECVAKVKTTLFFYKNFFNGPGRSAPATILTVPWLRVTMYGYNNQALYIYYLLNTPVPLRPPQHLKASLSLPTRMGGHQYLKYLSHFHFTYSNGIHGPHFVPTE